TLIGRVLPAAGDAVPLEYLRLDSTVADDSDREVFGRRADMKAQDFARHVGKSVGVAPDLSALGIHAGIFVIVAAYGKAPLLDGQAEVGKCRGGMRLVHWAFRLPAPRRPPAIDRVIGPAVKRRDCFEPRSGWSGPSQMTNWRKQGSLAQKRSRMASCML